MPTESFKFIHASDLRLSQSLSPVVAVRDEWKSWLVDAPLEAARRVFDLALEEQVDFLILAGDIVDVSDASPRTLTFLLDQFQRLHEKGIPIFWAGGAMDHPEDWPGPLRLPESVQVFAAGSVEELTPMRGDSALASLLGTSRARRGDVRLGEFDGEDANLVRIGVLHGKFDSHAIARQRIDYWALGGAPNRDIPSQNSSGMAVYPGSPQGRGFHEPGAHGCVVVNVEGKRARPRFAATDTVRWQEETLVAGAADSLENVEDQLVDRTKRLVAESDNRPQIVRWRIEGLDSWKVAASHAAWTDRMVSLLRDEFLRGKPSVLTTEVEIGEVASREASWFEEDTIRGDYLRSIRDALGSDENEIAIEAHLPDENVRAAWETDLRIDDRASRNAILASAATMGVELLSAEENQPLQARSRLVDRLAANRKRESRK